MARCGSAQDFAIVTGPVSDYWGLTNNNKLYANRSGVAIGFTAEPNYMLHVDGTLSASELLIPGGTTLDWNSVYTSVNLQSGEWDSTWNTLTANSAGWDRGASAYTTVNLQSGEWDSTWNTLTANSADWTWVAGNSATFYEDVLAKHNVTIDGDLTVKGTTATLEVTDLHVEDKLIRLNKGGAADTGFDVGFEIEEDGNVTGYIKTGDTSNDDKWLIKSPDGNILTLDIDADKTFQILGNLTVAHNANTGGSYIDQDVRQSAQNVTFAGLHVGSLSLSPQGLDGTLTTSTGDLKLDAQSNIVHFNATTFTLAAQTVDLLLKDNEAESLEVLEGSNKYLTFRTTDNDEQLIAQKQLSVNALLSAKEGIETNVITVTSSGSFGSGDNSAAAGLSSYGHMRVQNSYIEVDGINVDGHSIKTTGGASFGNSSTDKMDFNAGTWTFASRMYWNLHESHPDNRGLVFQKNGVGSPILVIDSDNIRIGVNTAAPSYELDVAGNIGLNEYIYHNSDDDTYIHFTPDDINIQAGGVDFIKITEDGTQDQIRFNDGGVDVDFVVETEDTADAFTIDGDAAGFATFKIPVTVGVDDTGHDVKFFGATAGQYLLWDESADELVLAGDTKLSFHDAAGGENIIATSDGHLEVNAGTTLDATAPTIDLNGATEVNVDAGLFDVNTTGNVDIDSGGNVDIASTTGTITLNAETDIILDANGANITFKDNDTEGLDFSNSGGDWTIKPLTTDKDVIFVEDGGTEIARFDSSAEALLMATDKKIEFRDSTEYIHSQADGHLDHVAATEIHLTAPTVNIDAITDTNISNNLTVGGDLTVNGTTTTVNSTTITVDDPIITLGGDTAPGSDDGMDRGVEFRYFSGSAKVGFFGRNNSTGRMVFIPDATNSFETFSGNRGELEVGGIRISDDGVSIGIQIGATSDNEIDTASGGLTLDSAGGTITVDDILYVTGHTGLQQTSPTESLHVGGNTRTTGSLSAEGGGYNYFANRVGIGTLEPTYELDIMSTTGIRLSGGSEPTTRVHAASSSTPVFELYKNAEEALADYTHRITGLHEDEIYPARWKMSIPNLAQDFQISGIAPYKLFSSGWTTGINDSFHDATDTNLNDGNKTNYAIAVSGMTAGAGTGDYIMLDTGPGGYDFNRIRMSSVLTDHYAVSGNIWSIKASDNNSGWSSAAVLGTVTLDDSEPDEQTTSWNSLGINKQYWRLERTPKKWAGGKWDFAQSSNWSDTRLVGGDKDKINDGTTNVNAFRQFGSAQGDVVYVDTQEWPLDLGRAFGYVKVNSNDTAPSADSEYEIIWDVKALPDKDSNGSSIDPSNVSNWSTHSELFDTSSSITVRDIHASSDTASWTPDNKYRYWGLVRSSSVGNSVIDGNYISEIQFDDQPIGGNWISEIQFYPTSHLFTPAVHINDQNHKVGLGTTEPNHKLTVIGTVSALNDLYTDSIFVSGDTALGKDSSKSIIFNSATWSIANATTVSVGGKLNFDSNTFVIDPSNNLIGVGTASPSSKAHIINSDQKYGQLRLGYDTTNFSILSTDSAGNLHIKPKEDQSVSFREHNVLLRKIVSENGDDVTIQTGDSSGNNFIVTNGSDNTMVVDGQYGDTGIGMSPANAQLSLGMASGNDNLRLYYDTNNYVRLSAQTYIANSSGGLKIETRINGKAAGGDPYSTNKTGAVYISGGRVGIGVQDPDHSLEISGGLHFGPLDNDPPAPANGDGGVLYTLNTGDLYYRSDTSQAGINISNTGLNKNGNVAESGLTLVAGDFTEVANAGGWAEQNGAIDAIGSGTLVVGRTADATGAQIKAFESGDWAGGFAAGGSCTIYASGGDSSDSASNKGGSFAFGQARQEGIIKTHAPGSFAMGYAYGLGTGDYKITGALSACGDGSFATGKVTGGRIMTKADGSFAHGYAGAGFGSLGADYEAFLRTDGRGSVALGVAENSYPATSDTSYPAKLHAKGAGSFAMGSATVGTPSFDSNWHYNKEAHIYTHADASGGFAMGHAYGGNSHGKIIARRVGTFAMGYAKNGFIEAGGAGSIVGGHVLGSTASGSQNFKIVSSQTGIGGIAWGYAQNANIETKEFGSVALGFAKGREISAGGKGSFAMGYAVNNQIQADGDNSFQFGEGTNGIDDSFAIGANFRFRQLTHVNHPSNSLLRDGDFWLKGTSVYLRTGGSNVQIGTASLNRFDAKMNGEVYGSRF